MIRETKLKIVKWVLGTVATAMSTLRSSVTHLFVQTPAKKQGDKFGNMVGAPAGGVVWPVDPALHDDMSFISADSFLALYDPGAQTATMLDIVDNGTFQPHPGQRDLVLGRNLFLPQPLNRRCVGLVIRTAEYGTSGIARNVFLAHVGGPGQPDFEIIAHHLAPSPNSNSTLVYDPDNAGRKGPVDDQWRVRMYNPLMQTPYDGTQRTGVVPPPPPPPDPDEMCVAWNGFESGVGDWRGYCLTFFGGYLARMSFVADGPLRPTSEKYYQSSTQEDHIHAGGLDTLAKWSNGDPTMDGPHRHQHVFEPPVQIAEGFRHRVDLMFNHDDPLTDHPTWVGMRRGMWEWSVVIPIVEKPPCDGVKDTIIDDGEATFDKIGGETFYMGTLGGGGFNIQPMPGINRLAR